VEVLPAAWANAHVWTVQAELGRHPRSNVGLRTSAKFLNNFDQVGETDAEMFGYKPP
jgi:hypothetical protein